MLQPRKKKRTETLQQFGGVKNFDHRGNVGFSVITALEEVFMVKPM